MLKSTFVSGYVTANVILLALAIVLAIVGLPFKLPLSLAASSIGVLVYFGALYSIDIPRTSKSLMPLLLVTLGGTLASVVYSAQYGISFAYSVYAFIASFLGSLLYVFWATSFSKRENEALKNGKKIENKSLLNAERQSVELHSLIKDYVIILFYRGNWCPFCTAQIKELTEQYKEIEKYNASVVLISPQSQKHTQDLAKKFEVPVHFLTDKDNEFAKSLDVLNKGGLPLGMQVLGYDSDVPYPTLIIADSNANVLYYNQTDNYRVRPEPSTFLSILKKHKEAETA